MTDLIQQIIERKKQARRSLADLPVGEKLRILERMLERDRKIGATRPAKPANPVRWKA
jgi:hypothetical protein